MDLIEEHHLMMNSAVTNNLSNNDTFVNFFEDNGDDYSVMSETEWLLLEQLGPRHLPYSSLIPMTVVYVLIFIAGMVGNCATCIVIAKNAYMQTATNYYLFNLAVADMLTLTLGNLVFIKSGNAALPLVTFNYCQFSLAVCC